MLMFGSVRSSRVRLVFSHVTFSGAPPNPKPSSSVKTSPRNTNRLINVSPMALTFAYGSINSQINAQSGEATLDEEVELALSAGRDARPDCARWVRVRAARNRNFNTQDVDAELLEARQRIEDEWKHWRNLQPSS